MSPPSIYGTLHEGRPGGAALPALRTEVHALLDGPLARVVVTQHFANDRPHPIEAVYAFPLAHAGAVAELTLVVGERRLRGLVKERAEARAVYEQARAAGARGALLDQERPDLFTLSVANVAPGEVVSVEIVVHHALSYDDGAFRFVFPMVPPHRYLDRTTPDADRLALARGPGGEARVREVSLRVDGRFPARLAGVRSVAHPTKLASCDLDRGCFSLTLGPEACHSATDFELEIRPAAVELLPMLQVHRGDGPGSPFLLTLVPDVDVVPERIGAREVVFVIDRSGSMQGTPLDQAQRALKACLRALGPADTFQLLVFDDRVDAFSQGAVAWSQRALELADIFLDCTKARGGTDIAAAMREALTRPCDPQRLRLVVFLTDGGVSNERDVLSGIERDLGGARIYAFGVGSAVNRGLLEGMARSGRGGVEFLLPGQDIEPAVLRFQARVAFPLLTDISLTFEPDLAEDVVPEKIPDLFVGQPVQVAGLFMGDGPRTLRLRGRLGRQSYEQEIPCPAADQRDGDQAVARLWARWRVGAMLERARKNPPEREALRHEIIRLGVAHGLVTPYTSLVAVEEAPDAVRPPRPSEQRVLPERLAPPPAPLPPVLGPLPPPSDAPETDLAAIEGSMRRRGFWPKSPLSVLDFQAELSRLLGSQMPAPTPAPTPAPAPAPPQPNDPDSLLGRARAWLKSHLDELIQRAKDPEKELNQVVADLSSMLVTAKMDVAVAIADEKRLARQAEEELITAAEWERRAALALTRGDDDLAREALLRKKDHAALAAELHAQRARQKASVDQLKAALRQINDRIEEARRKKNLLNARLARARSSQDIQSSMTGLKDSSAFEEFARLHSNAGDVMEAEAPAELAEQASGDQLAQKFQALEQAGSADSDLAALREKMGLAPSSTEAAAPTAPPAAAPGPSVGWAGAPGPQGAGASGGLPPRATAELGRTQRASGAWGRDGHDDLRRTCVALVLFALAKQTHRAGLYRPQLLRAMAFVEARIDACEGDDVLYIAWALRAVAGQTGHPRDRELLARALARLPASGGERVGAYARGEAVADEEGARACW